MFNLYKCAISNSLCGEWKLKRALQDMEAPAWSLGFFSYSKNNLKYAMCFSSHKGKSNISFGTVKGLLLFCVHSQYQHCAFIK